VGKYLYHALKRWGSRWAVSPRKTRSPYRRTGGLPQRFVTWQIQIELCDINRRGSLDGKAVQTVKGLGRNLARVVGIHNAGISLPRYPRQVSSSFRLVSMITTAHEFVDRLHPGQVTHECCTTNLCCTVAAGSVSGHLQRGHRERRTRKAFVHERRWPSVQQRPRAKVLRIWC